MQFPESEIFNHEQFYRRLLVRYIRGNQVLVLDLVFSIQLLST